MKTRIFAGLLALALLVTAFAAVSSAATDNTSSGKLAHFRYDSANKVGHLKVTHKSTTLKFRVPASTNCGVSFGQSGDQIPCKTLGKPKYANKPVHVTWTKHGAAKVASLVSVDLSK
jgi:hypothetical protein